MSFCQLKEIWFQMHHRCNKIIRFFTSLTNWCSYPTRRIQAITILHWNWSWKTFLIAYVERDPRTSYNHFRCKSIFQFWNREVFMKCLPDSLHRQDYKIHFHCAHFHATSHSCKLVNWKIVSILVKTEGFHFLQIVHSVNKGHNFFTSKQSDSIIILHLVPIFLLLSFHS